MKAQNVHSLRNKVQVFDPPAKILRLEGPRKHHQKLAAQEEFESPFLDHEEEKHYAVTGAIIAPESNHVSGLAISIETTISPLFEICNRFPKSIGVNGFSMRAFYEASKLKKLFLLSECNLLSQ